MSARLAPTTRFTDRAADYVRYRPSYPREAIDAIFQGLGSRGALTVADVGAGTGISTRLLAGDAAAPGPRVIAIEPNAAMRQAGAAEPHPRIEWREGTGEATGLADHSVGIVTCAQAFHWVDAGRGLAEFRRVLVPRGRVALFWNTRNPDDAATEAYYDAVARHAVDPPASPWASNDIHNNPFVIPLMQSPLFTGYRRLLFANEQDLDREAFLGRAMSASYVPNSGAAGEAVRADLNAAFDAHAKGGVLRMKYLTELHLAEAAT